jgi:hypothetical protein
LLCIYPFYHFAEYRGIVFSLLLWRLVFAVGFLACFFREDERSIVWYVRDVVLRVAVCSAVAFGAVYWSMARYELGFAVGLGARWGAVVQILIWSVPYLLISIAGFWKIAFEAEERATLNSFLGDRLAGWMSSAQPWNEGR